VRIWQGEQFEPWFVALNPNSKVPVIADPDGPDGTRHVVIESCAILLYLAEKTGTGLPNAPLARSSVLQWLIFQAANLGPMSGQLNHFVLYAPPDESYGRSRYVTEVRRQYEVLERALAVHDYVGSSEFSIADMAIYPWIANLSSRHSEAYPFLAAGSAEHPRLAEWFARCGRRPAVIRAEEAFRAIRSTLPAASEEEKDRVFGRNAHARTT
jgi:GST-like protein